MLKELKVNLSTADIIKKIHKCCYDTHSISNINEVFEIYKECFNL